MRVDYYKLYENFFIDVNLADSTARMRRVKKYEDRSAYALMPGQGIANVRVM